MENINHNGNLGVFLSSSEWKQVNNEITELRQQLEVSKQEAKYKLKKLAHIVERKDRQISRLRESAKIE